MPTTAHGASRLWRPDGAGYSSATDLWSTPPSLFSALNAEFAFELDVCATHDNATCARYFTNDEDGLRQPWTGSCWMNPPYGRAIGRWLEKAADAADAGATVVALVPARTDTRWWHDQVMARASEVRLVRGRLRFGDGRSPAPFPSAIIVFRPASGGAGPHVRTWSAPA